MIILLFILFILLIILGTLFLRKNTINADKLGLSLFLSSIGIFLLLLLQFSQGSTLSYRIFATLKNPFSSSNVVSKVKSKVTKIQEPFEGESTYVVGTDFPEGDYVVLADEGYKKTFRIVSEDKKEIITSSIESSWSNSYLGLKPGMIIYTKKEDIENLIPKENLTPTTVYPIKSGTYFAGTTIEAGSYYIIKNEGSDRSEVSFSSYASFYDNMTSNSISYRQGQEINFFSIQDGEGITFHNGQLYPLSDTSHIPESNKQLTAQTFLGGTTIDSGIYYLTSSDEPGYVLKNELDIAQDSKISVSIPRKSDYFYSISDGDVITLKDTQLNKLTSAPKYTKSTTTGAFLGDVTIPVGWYKVKRQTEDSETSKLEFSDLTSNKSCTIYANSFSSNYVYIDETSAISLDNVPIEKNTPKTLANQSVSTWIANNIDENIQLMQDVYLSDMTNNISSIYFHSYNSDYNILYKNEDKPLKEKKQKNLLTNISTINKSELLKLIYFNEDEATFVFELSEKMTLELFYSSEPNSLNYLPGMPLPNHPDWYYEIKESY